MKSTMVELVIELEKLKQELPEGCFEIHEMIEDAKSGEYHEKMDEQDKENMRNDILNNTNNGIEAQALIKALNL